METYLLSQSRLFLQRGAATLLTAVILLFSVSLVAVLISRSVQMESKVNADNYRAVQALNAANAALDYAFAYFEVNGMNNYIKSDEEDDGYPQEPFNPPEFKLTDPDNSNKILGYAKFYFINNLTDNEYACGGTESSLRRGMVVASGWSDDFEARREITACLTSPDIFAGGTGPKQPFVSKVSVGIGGTGKIINRFNNSSIWTGGNFDISSAAVSTYLRPPNKEIFDFNKSQLINPSPVTDENNASYDAQEISDNNTGNGYDNISNDSTLANKSSSTDSADLDDKTKNKFFDMFFSITKADMITLAKENDQYFTSKPSSWGNLKDLVWIEGDLSLSNSDRIGTKNSNSNSNSLVFDNDGNITDEPVLLIINGDLDMTGGLIHGIVYVTGSLKVTGGTIYGSVISESSEVESSPTGNPTIVYRPFNDEFFDDDNLNPAVSFIVPGSWKDWQLNQ